MLSMMTYDISGKVIRESRASLDLLEFLRHYWQGVS